VALLVANREIDKIIVHCSDSPDDRDIGFKEIDQWHKERGWDGVLVGIDSHRVYCGYHYIIKRDGTTQIGRPEHYIGAHCQGYNKTSLGIVWIGRESISTAQTDTLMTLLRMLTLRHGLSYSDVFGHCEFNPNKTCPNLDMNEIRVKLSGITQAGGT
jgi:N-acetylmuramoyl-L-alanine amidase